MGGRESMVAASMTRWRRCSARRGKRNRGKTDLFGGGESTPTAVTFELRDAAPWSEEERLTSEYAMLGFYVSGHPLEKYASRLQEMKSGVP